MMLLTLTTLFPALALALASPPIILPRQVPSNLTFTVTNFSAFMANPYIEGTQSNLSFHVIDPRPAHYAEVDCIIPPTYFSLWAITALYEYCGDRALDFQFQFQEGVVAVRRGWSEGGKSFVAIASQNPYWTNNGTSPNVTVTPTGKLYRREGEWKFPVTRLQRA
ncbi:hypothetical protein GQ43DRAFT_444738 [Delitschia confertaspora ATCC 74209]|uniref:Uncharacterized protein n=1 Tax=Delitschia confertaspora ATCC 74209 TaxID=1513339 RepID=A0A9P4JCP1_9PLEO|nr:hypothetical protein GQ43DRAFT_444738 [Delitschia confertaspora ATCC 74209]